MKDMETLSNNYSFFNDEHSKQYKHFFNKHKKILSSKWKTQQVMRKYRQKLSQLQNKLWSLDWDIDEMKEYSNLLLEAKDIYMKNFSDNNISNEGYDIVNDIREEERWQREKELEEFKEEQNHIQKQLEKDHFENED